MDIQYKNDLNKQKLRSKTHSNRFLILIYSIQCFNNSISSVISIDRIEIVKLKTLLIDQRKS